PRHFGCGCLVVIGHGQASFCEPHFGCGGGMRPRAARFLNRGRGAADHDLLKSETSAKASRLSCTIPIKEDKMAYDDARVATADLKETHDLIASDKVEGTKVFDASGEHIGAIERILVEKRGGKV